MRGSLRIRMLMVLAGAAAVVPVDAQMDKGDRAWMRMALINHYEEEAGKAEDEASKKSAKAMVTVLYRELASDFAPGDLHEYVLVRTGHHLRTKTSTPRDALVYYDEVIGRKDPTYRFHAMLGRADIHADSDKAGDIDQALDDCAETYQKSESLLYRELALFGKIRLLVKKREYEMAAASARTYLDPDQAGFTKHAPQVGLLLAECLDKQGKMNEAIAAYEKVWSAHIGNIMVSAPAITRWVELVRDGQDGRQAIRRNGLGFIRATSQFKDNLTREELEILGLVEKLVQRDAGPSMEDVAREREK